MPSAEINRNTIKAYLDGLDPGPAAEDGVAFGTGEHCYQPLPNWPRLPEGMILGDVVATATVGDRIVVYTRGDDPVIVFDDAGNVLSRWGHDLFEQAHGVFAAPDNTLYFIDEADNTVRRCTIDGEVLMTIGTSGTQQPFMSGKPFSRPTDVALSPQGDIYVSDGYSNAHIHKFSAQGEHLLTWGGSGIGPGEFSIAHNIVCDDQGIVYVSDRENHRVQVFDGDGTFRTQWNYLHRPCGLELGPDGLFYVSELGPMLNANRHAPNLGPRITILNRDGEILSRLGDKHAGHAADRFVAPHSIGFAANGDLLVSEVSTNIWTQLFPSAAPSGLRTLRRLSRIT